MDRGGGGGRLSPSNALEDELCLIMDAGEDGGRDSGSSSRTTVANGNTHHDIIANMRKRRRRRERECSYLDDEEVWRVVCRECQR